MGNRKTFIIMGVLLLIIAFITYTFSTSNPSNWKIHQIGENRLELVPREETNMKKRTAICEGMRIDHEYCQNVTNRSVHTEGMYPLQYVSGCPGSGNGWLHWMALQKVTYNRWKGNPGCDIYSRWHSGIKNSSSPCLFLKTHEPYFKSPKEADAEMKIGAKSAVLIRHSFDSAFSEFKRQLVWEHKKNIRSKITFLSKNSVEGVSIEKFFTNSSATSISRSSKWARFSVHHVSLFEKHAQYWLEQWDRPLKILIYNDLKSDLHNLFPDLLMFFGLRLETHALNRLCCILENPFNPSLKRQKSAVDNYRELIYEKTPGLKKESEAAVEYVQNLLNNRWPRQYFLHRG